MERVNECESEFQIRHSGMQAARRPRDKENMPDSTARITRRWSFKRRGIYVTRIRRLITHVITVLRHEELLGGRGRSDGRDLPGVIARHKVREALRRVVQLIVEPASLAQEVGRAETGQGP
jgi:hypothetical protein